jgi:hypothetical protein
MTTSLTKYSVFFQAQFGPDNDGQGTVPATFSSGNEPSSSLVASGLDALSGVDAMIQSNGVGLEGTIANGVLHASGGVNVPAPPPGVPNGINQGGAIFNAGFTDALTVTQPVYVTFTPVFAGSYMGLASAGFLFTVGDTAVSGDFIFDSGSFSPGHPYQPPSQTFILSPGHTYATGLQLQISASGYAQEAGIQAGSATDFTAGFTVTELDALQNVVPDNPDLVWDSGFNYLAPIACFAAGTRIRCEHGDIAVERLNVGDLLPALWSGQTRKIQWIGHRHIECLRHPRPHDVWPVLVRASAFAPDMPYRDLLLSPDHAVFTNGVLIPIRHLINGTTIAQREVGEITYWHVELESHDVVLAEGLPCETYLDTGNRAAFTNGGAVVQLHASFVTRVWEADGCAKLVVAGPDLVAARRLLHGCGGLPDQGAGRAA